MKRITVHRPVPKQALSVILAAVTALLVLPVNVFAADTDVVNIPDDSLKAAIVEELGIGGLDPDLDTIQLTQADMDKLTELDAPGRGIKDLTGLWTAANLTSLDLSGNPLGEDVKGTAKFNTLFSGLENLKKLQTLDLSHCDLNEGSTTSYSAQAALAPKLPSLSELVTLDLSYNQMSSFTLYNYYTGNVNAKLETINVAGNALYDFVSDYSTYFPALKNLDISNNYIYYAEGQRTYDALIGLANIPVRHDNMKNLATLSTLYVAKPNAASNSRTYYTARSIPEGTYDIDLGEVMGGSLNIALDGAAVASTVKLTIDGTTYTAGSPSSSTAFYPFTLTGFSAGAHTLTVQSMHLGGDTAVYTLHFTVKSLPKGGDDWAGITDPNLQAAVAAKLGVTDYLNRAFTKDEVASMTGSLNVYNAADASGLQYATGLTGLSVTGTFEQYPDLSGLTKLTSLTFGNLPNLKNLPSLDAQTKLTTLTFDNLPNVTALPSAGKLTALKTLLITNDIPKVSALPDGIENAAALGTVQINYSPSIASDDMSRLKNLPALSSLSIMNSGLETFPKGVTQLNQIKTLNLSVNFLTAVPDLSGMTSLTDLDLGYNAFTEMPQTVAAASKLTSLSFSGNKIGGMDSDLSKLKLVSLNLMGCGLMEFPNPDDLPETIQSLYIDNNPIAEIKGSFAKFKNMTELNMANTRLEKMPEQLAELQSIKIIRMRGNYIREIPADYFDHFSTTLTSMALGYYFPLVYNQETKAYELDPDTSTYQAIQAMKERAPKAVIGFERGSTNYADLKSLQTNLGEVEYSDADSLTAPKSTFSFSAPEGTTSITITGVGVLDDTTITVGDKTIKSGETLTVDGLQNGGNTIAVVAKNPYNDSEETYTLNISVGDFVDPADFPKEGGEYSLPVDFLKETEDTNSMADQFFTETAHVLYQNGKFVVDLTTNRNDYLTSMQYLDNGEWVQAELVSKTGLFATYRVYASTLDEPLVLAPFVVPMGYSPRLRAVFDTSKIMLWDPDGSGGQDETASPAVDATDPATGIVVQADEGVLPKGTAPSVTAITGGADYEAAAKLLADVGAKFRLYDITLIGKDGAAVQPADGKVVKVSLPIPDGYDPARLVLYRINGDGTRTLIDGEAKGGYYVFYTNHFSRYALVEQGSTERDATADTVSDKRTGGGADGTASGDESEAGNPETGAQAHDLPLAAGALAAAGCAALLLTRRKPKQGR